MIDRLDIERARRADEQFAELLDLDEAARGRRLHELREADPRLAGLVERLLAATRMETQEALRGALAAGGGGVEPPVAAEAELVAPGTSFGAWQITRPLARGGMSQVFVAERVQGGFRQRAALKLFERSPELAAELVQRFEQERQILAALDHPNIARVLDGGVAKDGRPYLVLELIEGEPIDRWCLSRNPTLAERCELFVAAARAVQHAHRNLIVHRDLKPSNLLVTADGGVKLLDFGIAKVLSGSLALAGPDWVAASTRTASRPLTPAYASPEQVRGEPIQTTSDVYQLGLLLYELLAGRPAHLFREDSWRELERVVCEVEPPPLAHRRRRREDGAPSPSLRIPGELETIVRKALQKDPQRRYGSADHLADDVVRFLTDQPVLARPDTLRYRAGKFVRRHRVAVTGSAAVVAALLAGGITTAWQARVAARERDAARLAAKKSQRAFDLLLQVFEIADEGGGEAITARELVERTVERLRAEPAEAPLRAEQLAVLARADEGLGLTAAAAGLRAELVDLAKQKFGSESLEAARELDQLGNTLVLAGDFRAAISRLEEALRLQVAKLGPDHPETLTTSSHLSYALGVKGEVRRSLALREQVLAARVRLHGEVSAEVAQARNDFGRSLRFLGRTADAEHELRRAVELRRRLEGDRALSAGASLSNLAHVVLDRGDLVAAGDLAAEALAISERALRPGHPSLAGRLQLLGSVRLAENRLGEAETLFRRALELHRSALPSTHFSIAEAELALAEVLLASGRADEAEALTTAADERLQSSFPPGGFRVGQAEALLGACRAARGGGAAAVQLAQRGYESVVSELGSASPVARRAGLHLAAAQAAAGRAAASAP